MTEHPQPTTITVFCENCGGQHAAEYHHDSPHNGARVYEACCDVDYLVDYYTIAAAI